MFPVKIVQFDRRVGYIGYSWIRDRLFSPGYFLVGRYEKKGVFAG